MLFKGIPIIQKSSIRGILGHFGGYCASPTHLEYYFVQDLLEKMLANLGISGHFGPETGSKIKVNIQDFLQVIIEPKKNPKNSPRDTENPK